MNKLLLALMTALFLVGCATSGGATSASDTGGLPEIAGDEDAAYDALPDMVAAE